MAKEKEKKRNIAAEVYGFDRPRSNLPGVDKKLVLRVDPFMLREDGYIIPTEPMTKRKWWFLYYISFFIPIRNIAYKRFPFRD